MLMSLVTLVVLVATAPASDRAPASPAASAEADPLPRGSGKASHGEEVVCRREERTGSYLGGRKVCQTRDQWRELDDENARNIGNFSHRGSGERGR